MLLGVGPARPASTEPDARHLPVLSLPQLGLLPAARSVARNGDVYSFVVPRLNVGVSGWVASAPLSHATIPLALTVAFNTRVDVVIKNGYVVSLVSRVGSGQSAVRHCDSLTGAFQTSAPPRSRSGTIGVAYAPVRRDRAQQQSVTVEQASTPLGEDD